MNAFALLRDGFPLAEAESRINESAARGWAPWSHVETQSTHMRPACPRCCAGVRVLPVAEVCAAGCGWQRWRTQA